MASKPVPHTRYIDLMRNPGAIDTLARNTFCLGIEVSAQDFAAALGPRATEGAVLDKAVLGGDSALRRLLADATLFEERCRGLIAGRPFTFVTRDPDLKTVAALDFLRTCVSWSRWAGALEVEADEKMRPYWSGWLRRLRRIADNERGLGMPKKILETYRQTDLTLEACAELVGGWTWGGLRRTTPMSLDEAIRKANEAHLEPLYSLLERSLPST